MPAASRRSSVTVWSCAKSWKRRTAIAVVTSVESRIPARKSSGSLTRSDESTRPPSSGRGRILLLVLGGRDLVAHAPDRDDRRRVAELSPHLPNVDVDRPSVAGEGVAPDALEQLVARQHEPAVVEQLPEQIELLGS